MIDPPAVIVLSTFDWDKVLALLIPNITLIVLALLQIRKQNSLHTLFNSGLEEWKKDFLASMKAQGVLVGRAEVIAEQKEGKNA